MANRQTRLTSRPKPKGKRSVGAFFDRLEPIKTKTWLIASPKECIISANIATFAVNKNAAPFKPAKIKLTMAAVKEAMLPFFNKTKISFNTITILCIFYFIELYIPDCIKIM